MRGSFFKIAIMTVIAGIFMTGCLRKQVIEVDMSQGKNKQENISKTPTTGTPTEQIEQKGDTQQTPSITEPNLQAHEHFDKFNEAMRKKDYHEAQINGEAACNMGHTQACHAYGQLLVTLKNLDGAKEQFGKACETGLRQSCMQYGITLLNLGQTEEGVKTLDKACEMGDGVACGNLGLLYSGLKDILKKDDKTAKIYYAKACEFGANNAQKKIDFCDMAK